MGSALSENLIAAGYEVHGYDLDPRRVDSFSELGGSAQPSAGRVGTLCSLVMLSVRDSNSVREVVHGAEGLLSGDRAVTTIIDTTTGDPDSTVEMAKYLKGEGISYLDATISGSSEQIRKRKGVFLVGGEPDTFDRIRPILSLLSETFYYVGPSGAGSKTKLASNLILGLNRLALAEGLVFAERLGLDLSQFLEILRKTPAYSAAIDVKGEKMLSGDFSPQSKISQHRKDLDIILSYSEKLHQQLPLTRVHHQVLRMAENNGLAEADTSAVLAQLRDMIEEE